MPTPKGIWMIPAMMRSFGVYSRWAACGVKSPVMNTGKTRKATPITPMKAAVIHVHAHTLRLASFWLPAPRYCPTSVAAAMDMAKPGRKLIASMRMATMWRRGDLAASSTRRS